MYPIVYLVLNKVNQKQYVGITSFTIEKRWKEHLYSSASNTTNSVLHKAIRKYGKENFSVTQIASCLDYDHATAVESAVIVSVKAEYNMTGGGEFTRGRKLSEETKQRIAKSNTGKKRTEEQRRANSMQKKLLMQDPARRQKATEILAEARLLVDEPKRLLIISKSSRDRVWSEESRDKLSRARIGMRHTQEVLDKIALKKHKAVVCVTTGIAYKSVSEAAELTGLSISGISSVCLGKRQTIYGLIFKFIEKET